MWKDEKIKDFKIYDLSRLIGDPPMRQDLRTDFVPQNP